MLVGLCRCMHISNQRHLSDIIRTHNMPPVYYVLVSLKQWNVQVQCMVSDVAYRYVIITGDLNNDNNNSITQP